MKEAFDIAQTIEAIEMQTKNIEGQTVARLTVMAKDKTRELRKAETPNVSDASTKDTCTRMIDARQKEENATNEETSVISREHANWETGQALADKEAGGRRRASENWTTERTATHLDYSRQVEFGR